MFEQIKDFLTNRIFTSRLRVLTAVMVLLAGILITRLFVLQIVRGADYQENYDLTVEKDETIAATRGNIYDCNGKLLAYNELAYAITIEDNGTYENRKDRNKKMNQEISDIITHIEANGDSIDNNFGITRSSLSMTAAQHYSVSVRMFLDMQALMIWNTMTNWDLMKRKPHRIRSWTI